MTTADKVIKSKIGLLKPAQQLSNQAKLYNSKDAITAANLLNERVLPFYEEHWDTSVEDSD